MAPGLAVVDPATGRLLTSVDLPKPLHELSIRPLDVNRNDLIAVAMRYEGDRRDRLPLVGLYREGAALHLLRAPKPIERCMRHYAGSIAFDSTGTDLAVSGPRGHLATSRSVARPTRADDDGRNDRLHARP